MSKSFREDLTGQRFGRLTVIEFVPNDKPHAYWKCQCDCGNTIKTTTCSLRSGHSASCGCLNREKIIASCRVHGQWNTRLYRIWDKMKTRCYNSNSKAYKDYGGRGITVCDEWKNDFKAFYDWSMANGYTDELSIDRIDVNGNYEPSNCRFADRKTQQRNRRDNIKIEYQGEKQCLVDIARLLGIRPDVLYYRYHKGDRGERLFRPVKKKSK